MVMKFFVRINNVNLPISKSLASLIKEKVETTIHYDENNHTIFFLDKTNIPFFQVVTSTSFSHFYVLFFGKNYRISKSLYLALVTKKNIICARKKQYSRIDETVTAPLT